MTRDSVKESGAGAAGPEVGGSGGQHQLVPHRAQLLLELAGS